MVIGAGPGGSTAAAYLAQQGRRVLILEREAFPRFHIGESLLPASNLVFRELGVHARIHAAGFTEKRGATFLFEDGRSTRIQFGENKDVVDPTTFHVGRAEFDSILLDHAQEQGASLGQGWAVQSVERGNPFRVHCTDAAGRPQRVSCRAIVDASGRAGVLARQFGLRRVDPDLKKVAIYAHYRGVAMPRESAAGDIVVFARKDLGWLWLIPLGDGRVSVGAVLGQSVHRDLRNAPGGIRLQDLFRATIGAGAVLDAAEACTEVHTEADFSYSAARYAGPGWYLVGDAGSFLDPVFSTGMHIALSSAREAARAIAREWGGGRSSDRKYDARQKRRYQLYRRLVKGFYEPAFRDLFFSASPIPWIRAATVSVLSGNDDPSLKTRLGLAVFEFVARSKGRLASASSPRSN